MRVHVVRVLLALAALLIVSAGSASADILATSGEVHEGPPPASVAVNQHEHDDDSGPTPRGAHAFNEEQNYVTTAPIALDVCTTATSAFVTCPSPRGGRVRDTVDLRPGTIPANTCISSHMVHADRPGIGSATAGVVYDGSVTFDQPLLGIILLSPSLIASDVDPGLGPTTVVYDATPTRGLELDTEGDEIQINATANRVSFTFDNRLTMDQIRVITLGDPDVCPGQADAVVLSPDGASNEVATEHCVIASVRTETGGPATNVTVFFDVEGASETDGTPDDEDGSAATNEEGNAEHCYTGPETVGVDTITAFADNSRDGEHQPATEPADVATKTWIPADVSTVVAEPKFEENPVDTEHCVTATVRDVFANPIPGERVRFEVTGTATRNGTDVTDATGMAEFCYTSTVTGLDTIVVYVDEDNDATADDDEAQDVATKLWQPGDPATVSLDPKAAENEINSQHCVTATVRDAFDNPVPDALVRFAVAGVNERTGAAATDEGGQAEFCYTGGTQAGADLITAFADDNDNETQDVVEPGDTAAKTWLPLEPAILTLTPKAAQNIVGDEHCVQAHVTDIFLNPNPDVLVRFEVTGTAVRASTDRTDEGGIAEFCYTSTVSGLDLIHAYADTDEDNTQDAEEPFDDATKLWHPGDPASVVLTPETSTNEVGTEHCLQARVRDAFGNPTPNEQVVFDVEGASEDDADPADEDATAATDEDGNAVHCYTGPDLPGQDVIVAYADNNEDGARDPEEPFDEATKTWILPLSTPDCEITIRQGGWILTSTGSKGTFGGNARIDENGTITAGELEYHDHSALVPFDFHSDEVLRIVCDESRESAQIYGTARVNSSVPTYFRVSVADRDEPGSAPGPDTFQIITATYTSGPEDNPLQGGNIQIGRINQPR